MMELNAVLSTLEKLEKMHRSLLEIALSKTEVVKANDISQLDSILKTEQAHVAAIETLELQRQTQVKQYLTGKGLIASDKPSMLDLIAAAQNESILYKLEEVRDRLLEVVQKLKAQNELNQKLVFQSLQFINVSLNMMRPQAPQDQINYSDKEVLRQDRVAKKSYFDSQA
jgi:flagellar biosynthesis/type III secretory pathway chaperone